MLQMNGSEKSNRSKADYFEILIANELAQHYNLKKNFTEELKELRKSVLDFENGEYRVEEQERKAEKTSEQLINFLTKEGIAQIKDIKWIGRYHQTKHTLSDVDIIKYDDEIIGISLKSVRLGLGTQKNLGYRTLRACLGLNIDEDLEKMWDNVRGKLRGLNDRLKMLSYLPKSAIKNKKRVYPIIEEIGNECGFPVQVKSVTQSVENFNKLSNDKKGKFMKFVFGIEDNKKLLNVISQAEKVIIYWNKIYNSIISGERLEARKLMDVSYGIFLGDELIIRMQASFTNGIGISPYCQRAFLPG